MKNNLVGYIPPFSGAPGRTILFFSFVAALNRPPRTVVLVSAHEPVLARHLSEVRHVKAITNELTESDSCFVVENPPRCSEMGLILLGLTPSLEDVSFARRSISQFLEQGTPRENIWPFLINAGMPGGLTADTITSEIGPLSGEWPFDPNLVLLAENNARLLQHIKPKAPLVRAIVALADRVFNNMEKETAAESCSSSSRTDENALENKVIQGLWRRWLETDDLQTTSPASLSAHIDREIEAMLVKGEQLDPDRWDRFRTRIKEHVLGFGPLEGLLADASLNEIMVNGLDVYVEKNGVIYPSAVKFQSEKQVRIVIDRMVGRAGRRVDLSSPMCDVRLPDGSRVNVILPPLSLSGPVVTIRRFRSHYQTMDDLIRCGTLGELDAAFLKQAVLERQNILIAGNTGSGKTTLLNILSGHINPKERIITLEDTAELKLQQAHVIRLETRTRNMEGAGAIGMADLFVNALRMRPDRLIVGECRGSEVVPMLQAMNTGHDGSMTTLHANSALDAMNRLESMVSLAVSNWSPTFVREQIAAGFDLVIYLKREGSRRKLVEIATLEMEAGLLQLRPVLEFQTV